MQNEYTAHAKKHRLRQEVSIFGTDLKDRGLWGREFASHSGNVIALIHMPMLILLPTAKVNGISKQITKSKHRCTDFGLSLDESKNPFHQRDT